MNSNRENSAPVDPETETKSALKLGHDTASYHRRLRLRVIVKMMMLCAFVVTVYVGLASFSTEDDVGSERTTLKVTLTDLEPGMMKSLVWESRPVLVYRRTAEEIDALDFAAVDDREDRGDRGDRGDDRRDQSTRNAKNPDPIAQGIVFWTKFLGIVPSDSRLPMPDFDFRMTGISMMLENIAKPTAPPTSAAIPGLFIGSANNKTAGTAQWARLPPMPIQSKDCLLLF